MWDYVGLVLTPRDSWPLSVEVPTDLADVGRYAVALDNPFAEAGGCLHFRCAGQQATAYSARFRDFDWRALYERQGGGAFIDTLAERARKEYDFVLIDSRTGVADTSGICSVQMPDEVVLCFTYNRQSVKGVAAVAQSIKVQRPPPKGPPVWPVPMRVEKGISGLEEAREFAREELDRFLPQAWDADKRSGYWANCEIAYYPDYAFGETLAVFGDRKQARNSLVADMRWLASHLAGPGRELALPSLDSKQRDIILTRYRLRDPRKSELAELRRQPLSSSSAHWLALANQAFQSAEPDEDYQVALGQALSDAVRSGLDQPDAALSLALPTTELWRRLALDGGRDLQNGLGESLGLLLGILGALGRHEDALTASREAVQTYRALAASNPETFRSKLAAALGNQANILAALEAPGGSPKGVAGGG